MMRAEETLLEPAATPAPVFAYRALRSIFFASPDSSPERGSNKENVFPERMSPVKLTPSKTNYASKSSPLKRKRDSGPASSPTKSILRTPGLPTPRAKSLRDVNVKFKSISPEIARKNEQQQQQKRGSDATAHCDVDSNNKLTIRQKDAQIASKQNPTAKKSPTIATESTSSTSPEDELEAYMRQTEKEMKKLVRYGQKMREYARRQDEENAKLRSLLEQAQKENERLRRAECESAHSGFEREAQRDSMNLRRRDQQQPLPRDDKSSMGEDGKSLAIPQLKRLKSSGIYQDSTTSRKPLSFENSRRDLQRERPEAEEQCIQFDIAFRTGQRQISHGAGSARVAPDRLAAARERVRKKAQLRRASAEVGDSQVDWAAL